MNKSIKIIFTILHLASIVVLLINFALKTSTDFRFNHNFTNWFSTLLYISAIVLLITTLKKRKIIAKIYFGIYPLFLAFNLIAWNKMNKALNVLHFYPILENNIEYEDERIVIYNNHNVSRNLQYDIFLKRSLHIDSKFKTITLNDDHKVPLMIRHDANLYTILAKNMRYYPKGVFVDDTTSVQRILLTDTIEFSLEEIPQ